MASKKSRARGKTSKAAKATVAAVETAEPQAKPQAGPGQSVVALLGKNREHRRHVVVAGERQFNVHVDGQSYHHVSEEADGTWQYMAD